MMSHEFLIKINNLIDTFNFNQQMIARELMINPNFHLYEDSAFGFNRILIKEKKSGNIYYFQDYVRGKCNCGD